MLKSPCAPCEVVQAGTSSQASLFLPYLGLGYTNHVLMWLML